MARAFARATAIQLVAQTCVGGQRSCQCLQRTLLPQPADAPGKRLPEGSPHATRGRWADIGCRPEGRAVRWNANGVSGRSRRVRHVASQCPGFKQENKQQKDSKKKKDSPPPPLASRYHGSRNLMAARAGKHSTLGCEMRCVEYFFSVYLGTNFA